MKTCTKCKVEKEIKEFAVKDGAAGNRDSRCFVCRTAQCKEKYLLRKKKREDG